MSPESLNHGYRAISLHPHATSTSRRQRATGREIRWVRSPTADHLPDAPAGAESIQTMTIAGLGTVLTAFTREPAGKNCVVWGAVPTLSLENPRARPAPGATLLPFLGVGRDQGFVLRMMRGTGWGVGTVTQPRFGFFAVTRSQLAVRAQLGRRTWWLRRWRYASNRVLTADGTSVLEQRQLRGIWRWKSGDELDLAVALVLTRAIAANVTGFLAG